MRLEDNDDILHLCEPKVALFMTCPLRRLVVQQLHGHRNLEWVGENAFAVAVPVTWLQYSLKCAGLQGRQYLSISQRTLSKLEPLARFAKISTVGLLHAIADGGINSQLKIP